MGRLRMITLLTGLATAVTLTAVPTGLAQATRTPPMTHPLMAWDITTVAGDGGSGYSGDGGPATSAEIGNPSDVTMDGAGNQIIAANDSDVIRVVAGMTGTFYGQQMTAGDIYTVAGDGTAGYSGDGGPATSAQLSDPWGAAVDADGNLVIADTGNSRIRVVAGMTGTFYGQQMTAGDIYTVAGDGTAGYSGDGGPATSAEFRDPVGVASDGAGDLFISDEGNDVIRMVAGSTGTLFGQAMTLGDIYTLPGLLSAPEGISTDNFGNVVIADTGDNVVKVIAASDGTFFGRHMTTGDIYTVAGNGTPGYSGDGGPATSARLAAPLGIVMAGKSTLFIADAANNRIRMAGPGSAPQFSSGTASTWFTGSPGSFQVVAAGTGVVSFTETGALPAGVSFSSPTGLITGTPATGSTGTYPITITATGTNGKSAQQSFTLTVDTPCTTTVAATKKIPADIVTTVPVTSLPACLATVTKARPTDIGSSLVSLLKTETRSSDLLRVETTAATTATAGATVDFTPVVDGTLTCTGFTGTVTFTPALHNNISYMPKETINGKPTHCEIQATPAAGPNATRATARHNLHPETCVLCWVIGAATVILVELIVTDESIGLAAEEAGKFSINVIGRPPSGIIQPPTESLLPSHFAEDSAGYLALVPDGPMTPETSGSLAGPDAGASSTFNFTTSVTPAQLNAMAATKAGVKTLKFTSGSLYLG